MQNPRLGIKVQHSVKALAQNHPVAFVKRGISVTTAESPGNQIGFWGIEHQRPQLRGVFGTISHAFFNGVSPPAAKVNGGAYLKRRRTHPPPSAEIAPIATMSTPQM